MHIRETGDIDKEGKNRKCDVRKDIYTKIYFYSFINHIMNVQ